MFHVFVLPALRYLSGYPNPNLPVINVELTNDIELDQRPEYHRAILDFQTMTAKSTGSQTSSRTQSLTGANCLLQLPGRTSDRPKLFRGATVTAVVITLPQ
jgi:gephyrin